MKKIIKILLVKLNALNTLHKTYKKCVCIIPMNQNNKISQSRKNQIIRDIQQQQNNKEAMI